MRTQTSLTKLAAEHEIVDVSPTGCPAHFKIAVHKCPEAAGGAGLPAGARPESGRFANGRGLSDAAAIVSCLGEAAELYSCCEWGDEACISATISDIGNQAIEAKCLLGLSGTQLANRTSWNNEYGFFDWWPRPQASNAVIDWLKVEDVHSGAEYFAPADFVLIGRKEAGDETAVAIADSNGCASGQSLAHASLNGLLELVERDALARWWYASRQRLILPWQELGLDESLVEYLTGRERQTLLFLATSDIGIPATVAVTMDSDGRRVAIGSSAACTLLQAAESALVEVLQMEVSLEAASRNPGMSPAWDIWFHHVSRSTGPIALGQTGNLASQDPVLASCPIEEQWNRMKALCKSAGIRIFRTDLTREAIGVPSVRMISIDLCHFKPRFGRQRLLTKDVHDGASPLKTPNSIPLLV